MGSPPAPGPKALPSTSCHTVTLWLNFCLLLENASPPFLLTPPPVPGGSSPPNWCQETSRSTQGWGHLCPGRVTLSSGRSQPSEPTQHQEMELRVLCSDGTPLSQETWHRHSGASTSCPAQPAVQAGLSWTLPAGLLMATTSHQGLRRAQIFL